MAHDEDVTRPAFDANEAPTRPGATARKRADTPSMRPTVRPNRPRALRTGKGLPAPEVEIGRVRGRGARRPPADVEVVTADLRRDPRHE